MPADQVRKPIGFFKSDVPLDVIVANGTLVMVSAPFNMSPQI
jgi:hypothetical protein